MWLNYTRLWNKPGKEFLQAAGYTESVKYGMLQHDTPSCGCSPPAGIRSPVDAGNYRYRMIEDNQA